MQRRFTGIAAFLLLLLMMPLSRACALASPATTARQDCCRHGLIADACCTKSSALCYAQAPVDTRFPGQDLSTLLPPLTVLVKMAYPDRLDSFRPYRFTQRPMQHSPPGLLITATTVLRT